MVWLAGFLAKRRNDGINGDDTYDICYTDIYYTVLSTLLYDYILLYTKIYKTLPNIYFILHTYTYTMMTTNHINDGYDIRCPEIFIFVVSFQIYFFYLKP